MNIMTDHSVAALADSWPLPEPKQWELAVCRRVLALGSADIGKKVIRQWPLWAGYICSEERWTHFSDPRPVTITAVYNSRGQYVGDPKFARYLISQGIVAELKSPEYSVCSVGFCAREKKWAGWSHRALCLFGVGDRIFEEDYGDDRTLFTEHGSQVIKDLADARQAACAFADYVS